jgi:hypothetical protein
VTDLALSKIRENVTQTNMLNGSTHYPTRSPIILIILDPKMAATRDAAEVAKLLHALKMSVPHPQEGHS